MKKITSFLICFISLSLYAQVNTIKLPDLSTIKADIDTIVFEDQYLLQIDIDTLYIINKKGVDGYNRAVDLYNELHQDCEEYQKAEKIIDAISSEFKELNSNIESLEDKYELSLKSNLTENKKLREENELINKRLKASINSIKDAEHKVKNEKWKSKAEKILWGTGGVLVGMLVQGTISSINN